MKSPATLSNQTRVMAANEKEPPARAQKDMLIPEALRQMGHYVWWDTAAAAPKKTYPR